MNKRIDFIGVPFPRYRLSLSNLGLGNSPKRFGDPHDLPLFLSFCDRNRQKIDKSFGGWIIAVVI